MQNRSAFSHRSWLFTPASRPDRFPHGAGPGGADIVILDLEDAVAPADKEQARFAAVRFLGSSSARSYGAALRFNALDTPAGIADIAAVVQSDAQPDFVVLPKTESAAHIRILDRLLSSAGKRAGLVGLIESAAGLKEAEAIAAASPRLRGLLFGAADMAADLSASTAWDALSHARGRVVSACALSGVLAIDTPFFDVHDRDGLASEMAKAIAMGFSAKAAIHPNQIPTINAALTPSAADVEKARAVLRENAKGVGTVSGQMIDEAVARKARRVLQAAGLTG
jgi:(S)-citramalyl-CoA lyase